MTLIAAGLAIAIGLAAWGSTRSADETNDNAPSAVYACEENVKQKLRSPATAKFNSQARDAGDRVWKVVGTVDSDNSFGATIRSDFACTAEIKGDAISTTLDYLE